MKKNIVCILLVMTILTGMAAFAEGAVRSVTASDIVIPSGATVTEEIKIYLPPVESESVEAKVMEEIVAFAEAAPVIEYFPEETITAIVEKLPETVAAENLTIDEFFPLREIGYEESIGEIEATFEFAVSYKDDDVVIALIGVPSEAIENMLEDSFVDENGIVWMPMDTRIEQGKVKVTLTEEAMTGVKTGKAMIAILRDGKLQ